MCDKLVTIDEVFNLLTLQKFADFYNDGGEFDSWICGDDGAPSKSDVKAKLARMLGK